MTVLIVEFSYLNPFNESYNTQIREEEMDAYHNLDIESNNCRLVKMSKLQENMFKGCNKNELNEANLQFDTETNCSKFDSSIDVSTDKICSQTTNYCNGIVHYLENKLSQKDSEITHLKEDNKKIVTENEALRAYIEDLKVLNLKINKELVLEKTKFEGLNDFINQLQMENKRFREESIGEDRILLEQLSQQIASINKKFSCTDIEAKERINQINILNSLLEDVKIQRNNFEALFREKQHECINLEKSLSQFKLDSFRNKLKISYIEDKCEEKQSAIVKLSDEIKEYTAHIKNLERDRIKLKTALAYNDEYIYKLETCWSQGLAIYEETKFELKKKNKELEKANLIISELKNQAFI